MKDPRDIVIRIGLSLLVLLGLLSALIAADGNVPPAASPTGLVLVSYSSGSNEIFTSCDGIVENQYPYTISHAEIGFTITDSSGAVIGTARGYLSTPLPPGGRWRFEATCFRSVPGGQSRLAYLTGY